MLKPDDMLEFKRDGVQDGVYRKLRLGKYPIQARLDLHRKTLKEARSEVIQFIRQCMAMDIRTLLIVHGRGERSTPPALMKSFVSHWLTQISEVQCAHSAQRLHGGTVRFTSYFVRVPRKKPKTVSVTRNGLAK